MNKPPEFRETPLWKSQQSALSPQQKLLTEA
jgi:hypothetical protein